MKILFLCIWLFFFACSAHAQQTAVMAFPITGYIVEADSLTITQVLIPVGVQVKERSLCIIKSIYAAETQDSVITLGAGRLSMVKGEYYYFGFRKKSLMRKPVAGELLYTNVILPPFYQGLIFDVLRHNITLNNVNEVLVADRNTALKLQTAADEIAVIDQLISDVKYTATEMAKMNNSQDQMINSGRFKGKKLFVSMQSITNEDVTELLKYIKARPNNYAGHTWKFSEIMATWMVSGAPMVVKG